MTKVNMGLMAKFFPSVIKNHHNPHLLARAHVSTKPMETISNYFRETSPVHLFIRPKLLLRMMVVTAGFGSNRLRRFSSTLSGGVAENINI